MDIREATASYERWMGHYTRIVRPDLRFKHQQMTQSVFSFLRATFYRWVQVWRAVIPTVAAAPKVLAVGDLHIANFGTWRDFEGQLIWGINDFDEAFRLPYTIDLVRLVASAHLAIRDDHLGLRPRTASEAVLDGYQDALREGGRPMVLGESNNWLTRIAINRLRDPVAFWGHLDSSHDFRRPVPQVVQRAVDAMLPAHGIVGRRKSRIAGLGSLGHERILFLANWCGARIVREAKALVPSAAYWAQPLESDSGIGEPQASGATGERTRASRVPPVPSRRAEPRIGDATIVTGRAARLLKNDSLAHRKAAKVKRGDAGKACIEYGAILRNAIRVPDPYVRAVDNWLIRRLAPDCSRIEIDSLSGKRDEDRLLYAMGWETANIHLGSERDIAGVRRDLRGRPGNWLHHAAKEMVRAVKNDWRDWRSGTKNG